MRKGAAELRRAFAAIRPELDGSDVRRLSAALAYVAAGATLAALGPAVLAFLIDTLTQGGAALPGGGLILAPLFLMAIYVGSQWLSRIVVELRAFLFGGVEQSVTRKLSRRLFSHIMALPLRFHLQRATGAVTQTLENGLLGYRIVLNHALFTILPALLEIIVMSIVIAVVLDPVFLLVFAACTVAYIIVFADGVRRVLRASREVSTARVDATAQLADGLINVDTVKSFSGEGTFTRRYDTALAATQERWRAFYRARFRNGAQVATVFAAGLTATLWLAIARVEANAMTIGDFVLINAYMLQIVRPLEMLGSGFRDIGQGTAFIERMLDLLDEEPEPDHLTAARPAGDGSAPASIVFENVAFEYHAGRPVLNDLSFEVAPGSMTALVGSSGGGKSSIVRLILRYYEPTSGRILFDGVPLTDYPPTELRRLIAVVPQDTSLFNASLAFNIGFPDDETAHEEIEAAARLANLEDLIARLPDGYDMPRFHTQCYPEPPTRATDMGPVSWFFIEWIGYKWVSDPNSDSGSLGTADWATNWIQNGLQSVRDRLLTNCFYTIKNSIRFPSPLHPSARRCLI